MIFGLNHISYLYIVYGVLERREDLAMSTIPYRPSIVTLVTEASFTFDHALGLKVRSSRRASYELTIVGVRVWRELGRPQHLHISCRLGGSNGLTDRHLEWFQQDFKFKNMSLAYVPMKTREDAVVFSYEYDVLTDFESAGRLAILAVLGHLLEIEVLHPEILQAMKESATFKTKLCYQLSDSIVPLEEHWSDRVS